MTQILIYLFFDFIYQQEYPERSGELDIMHDVPLIESYDNSVLESVDELVSYWIIYIRCKIFCLIPIHFRKCLSMENCQGNCITDQYFILSPESKCYHIHFM